MSLPYGWSQDYTLNFLFKEVQEQRDEITALQHKVSSLAAEVERLEQIKANRKGRPPKATAQPKEARMEKTQ